MRQLIERWGLREPILDLAERGAPIFGTCAGMIVLAAEIAGGEAPILPLLDVTVERNAFGRQLDSFEAELDVPVLGDTPVHAVFIRAPIIERTGPDVDVLARLDDGRIVAVRERNIIATAFHPELAGETRFHRLRRDDGRRARRSGRGLGPPPASDAPVEAAAMTERRMTRPAPRSRARSGAARLTDLAALGELSRLCQSDGADTRSLGLPVSGPPIGVFSLFRLPLGAFRPNDLMYVYEEDGPDRRPRPRRARGGPRRVDDRGARCRRDGRRRRHPLPARPAAPARGREARRPPASTSPAPTPTATSSCSCRPGFMRYGEERSSSGRPAGTCPEPWSDEARRGCGHPAGRAARRAGRSSRLYAVATPSPVARLEAIRLPTGSARARTGACPARAWPRSCASPTSRGSSRSRPAAARTAPSSTGSSRSGSPRRTSRTTSRSSPGPRPTRPRSWASGSGSSRRAPTKGGERHSEHGVIAPVRTYESPIDRRLEEAGFDSIASVTLLMKETLVRVAEPALVPAGVR